MSTNKLNWQQKFLFLKKFQRNPCPVAEMCLILILISKIVNLGNKQRLTYLLLKIRFASKINSFKFVPINERQNTTISTLLSSKGT